MMMMRLEFVSESLSASAAAVDADDDSEAAEHRCNDDDDDQPRGETVLCAIARRVIIRVEAVAAEAISATFARLVEATTERAALGAGCIAVEVAHYRLGEEQSS